jgi:predicted RNA-binding protein with PIN domain
VLSVFSVVRSLVFVVIDGYNLLRLVEKMEGWEAITDRQLCMMISQYLRRIAATGQVVFDGIGPPDKASFENLAALEVVFSGRRSDADSIILDKIDLYSAPKSLVVVSSDRELATAAKRRKCVPVKSQVFFAQMVAELDKKRKPPQEPPQKRTGITDGETEEWLKTFGFKK